MHSRDWVSIEHIREEDCAVALCSISPNPSRNAALVSVRMRAGLSESQRTRTIGLIRQAVAKVIADGDLDPEQPWRALELLCADYMGGE